MYDREIITKNEQNGRTYYRQLPISGTKYGDLSLTGGYAIKNSVTHVEVLCSCGKTFFTNWIHLRIEKTKSCGCKTNEFKGKASFRHGFATAGDHHPLYSTWADAKSRCFNKNEPKFYNYGGRGIGMCKEWVDDFMAFYNWAINNGWYEGCNLTLDRIDNNGNYEPTNCRWATDKEQNRNKRTNVLLTAWGETKVQRDWTNDERCKVSEKTLRRRLKKGWNTEDALTKPRTAA